MKRILAGDTPLVRSLSRLTELGADDLNALSNLAFEVEDVRVNRYLVREGERVHRCGLLIDGFAARDKLARSGKRQIVSFHIPGDMLDLQHILLTRADHNVLTISAATIGWIDHGTLKATISERPAIAEALACEALVDASVFREWVLNVGCRDAKTRIAHMLCEFVVRRQARGTSPKESCVLPFIQEEIGDATGLTAVHVNRMMRKLSEDDVFQRDGAKYIVSDLAKLKVIAAFDPSYLHLSG